MKIDIVQSDNGDWMGLYLNGKLVYEGHSIEPEHILEALEIPYEYHHDVLVNGWLPFDLKDAIGEIYNVKRT